MAECCIFCFALLGLVHFFAGCMFAALGHTGLAWVCAIACAGCLCGIGFLLNYIKKRKKAADPLKSTRFFTLRWVPDDPAVPDSPGSYQTVLVTAEELLNGDDPPRP